MDQHRKRFLGLFLIGFILSAAVARPDQALTWSRIGKGGLDGPYNPLQEDLNAACLFGGKLCVGTWGGQIWSYDGSEWVLIHKPKPGKNLIREVQSLAVLGDYLYAGMYLSNQTCQVWRTSGTGKLPYRWTKVSGAANIENSEAHEAPSMAVVKGVLYVGTEGYYGCQVWSYNGSAWTEVVGQGSAGSATGPGFGDKANYVASSMTSSASGDLYVGTGRHDGGEVWRLNSSGWAMVNKPGFGVSSNFRIQTLAFFNDSLYGGTINDEKGAQVWKYVGPGPSNWKAVGLNGMGDVKNRLVASAAVFGDPARLYVITDNGERGCQVLRTNGKTWEKANANGFGEGPTNCIGGFLAVFRGKLTAGLDSDFGGRVYATAGGAKVPFAWTQVNDSGFTRNDNELFGAAAFFGGKLYVGTHNSLGCEVWRYEGNGWTQVATGGFGDPYNDSVWSMAVANGYLYAGAENWETGAEIWRYDGSKWTQANKSGFGDASSGMASAMAVHQNKLYVGTRNYDHGATIWRCDGLKTSQWTKVNTNGFGVLATIGIQSLAVFSNKLYAGTLDESGRCRVWRYDGPGPSGWTAANEAGFGVDSNYAASGLAVYTGALYAETWTEGNGGCEVWRYSGAGTAWSQVNVGGFGKAANEYADSMIVFKNLMYVGTWNESNGGEIWSYDGSVWSQVNKSGFGANTNIGIESIASDGTDLYAGTENDFTGGEVWTTGTGSASPPIFRAAPFPSIPRVHRRHPREASQPRLHSRTR